MKTTHIEIGDNVALDTFSSELIINNEEGSKRVRIEPIMAQLIAIMVVNAGALVTRQELIKEVWNGNEGVGSKALTKNIYKIRKVFEAHGLDNPIETLPKKGYRFNLLKKRFIANRPKKHWLIAAAVIGALLILNMAVPGLIHEMAQRLGH